MRFDAEAQLELRPADDSRFPNEHQLSAIETLQEFQDLPHSQQASLLSNIPTLSLTAKDLDEARIAPINWGLKVRDFEMWVTGYDLQSEDRKAGDHCLVLLYSLTPGPVCGVVLRVEGKHIADATWALPEENKLGLMDRLRWRLGKGSTPPLFGTTLQVTTEPRK
ncbi:MAG: hypothetical protein AAF581_10600 [Planctomycetota bacterium]